MGPLSGRLAILMPLVFLAGGCVGDGPEEPTGGAHLQLEFAHLDLGTVEAGQSASAELTLTSVGDATLHIGDLTLIGPPVFEVDRPWSEVAFPPGESLAVTVTFVPETDATYDAILVVDSDDETSPSVSVSLSGMGIAPEILLSPPTHDFGEVEVGCVTETEVTVRNVGSLPLVIEGVAFQPTSDELVMVSGPPSGSTLDAQDTATVTLQYSPRDEIPDVGYLHVVSDDPLTPDALATQTGSAHFDGVVVDEFEQVHQATDILWAVDTSCSMSSNQSNLMDNFASFIDIIEYLGLDYHVAVIKTQGSYFQGATPIITPATPDPLTAFLDDVTMEFSGTHGQAMEMARQALTPPESAPGGPNHGFLRDYASLHIIFISDQDDFSPGSVVDQVSQLQALKFDPDWVVLHGVTGQWTGCSSAVGFGGASPRYEEAIAMTGGVSTSLCDDQWIDALFDAEVVSSVINRLELSQTPAVGTLEVAFDGVPAHAGWTYDPATNTVVFEQGHSPNEGDRITVTYRQLGSC